MLCTHAHAHNDPHTHPRDHQEEGYRPNTNHAPSRSRVRFDLDGRRGSSSSGGGGGERGRWEEDRDYSWQEAG